MTPSLTILGGGGWFPAHGRQTACALLRTGPSAVVIDAGTGLVRLIERPELLSGIERLDIILTHFHLDHIAGLAALPAVELSAETTIWGPGQLMFDAPTAEILSTVSHEPFHPVPHERLGVAVLDLPDVEIEIGGHVVRMRRQDRHSTPTLGLRFDDLLTWVTDTAYDHGSAGFAAGSRVLAHEAWYTHAAPRTPHIHSSAAEAATVARDAGVQELLLIHIPPFSATYDDILAEAETVAGMAPHPARDGADVSHLLGAGTAAGVSGPRSTR
jgi:ribonuclease BN (tRNA processing enzyme)